MSEIEPTAADRHLLFGRRREPHGDVKIYGGEIGVSLEDGRADGLLLLAFDNGFGHPMTWHFTPEDAAAFRDLFIAKVGQSDARHVAERESGLRAEIERLRKLVESAFREGYASPPYGQSQNQAWWASRARAAVEQQENTP